MLSIYLLLCCRDFGRFISIQEEISECFKLIKTFTNDKGFVTHVRNHSTELKNIEEQLDQNLLDLKRTDCSIVFAGKSLIVWISLILLITSLSCEYSFKMLLNDILYIH